MAIELYNQNQHICLMFADLVKAGSGAVQANQFMIGSGSHLALIDPGGNMTHNGILLGKYSHFPSAKLEAILASHADPDIVGSLNKWMIQSESRLYVPQIWSRFVPHFCNDDYSHRIIPIPDGGMDIRLGDTVIKAIPAHFLHSEGNFQFYDPVSKILFSGDLGASLGFPGDPGSPVTDFDAHLPFMEPFHKRYMNSNKICRFWVNMVRDLDMEWMVPQHGRPFRGRAVINRFLRWLENLECGIDLMTQYDYRIR